MAKNENKSPLALYGWRLLELGISFVPIAPHTKRPGEFTNGEWRGMSQWHRFAQRLPTDKELEIWEQWPNAQIGLITGAISNIVGVDKDYEVAIAEDSIQQLIPYSPLAKRGEKGWTRFFRYNGERSCSFNVQGVRVIDVLSDGRQTLIPPSIHPSGCQYVWITEMSIEDLVNVSELPSLPSNFLAECERILARHQTEADRKYLRKNVAPPDAPNTRVDTSLSIAQEYWHDLNQKALETLSLWVPRLIPTAKHERDGYRCVATWRGAKNPNVGIDPKGIRDWGGNYGMTPIDLVKNANDLTYSRAAEILRSVVPMTEPEPMRFTVCGEVVFLDETAQPTPAEKKTTPAIVTDLPWNRKTKRERNLIESTAPVDPVVLPAEDGNVRVAVPAFFTNPPGILADVVQWITETAPKPQPELSAAAAVAFGSAVTQRIYRSNMANYTSLYVVMVAKSTEGKEHPQKSVERILVEADLAHLVSGSGYTSSGAVFSALLRQPSHIAIIDEMGKLLKFARSKGQANTEAAMDKLIEAYGRLDGTLRPPTYSTMTLSSNQAEGIADKLIHNPAISILGATTPATFYESLTDDMVRDGFLGRLTVVESTQPRQRTRIIAQTDPPAHIVEWARAVHWPAALGDGNLASVRCADMRARTIEMRITEDCEDMLMDFEDELMMLKERYEPEGLDVLLGRTLEKSLRLAMVAAKAEDPNAVRVRRHHLEWAVQFNRYCDTGLIRAVRRNRFLGQTDSTIKDILDFIAHAKTMAADPRYAEHAKVLETGGVPHSMLLRRTRLKSKEFKEIIDTAREAHVLRSTLGTALGYMGEVYYVRGA